MPLVIQEFPHESLSGGMYEQPFAAHLSVFKLSSILGAVVEDHGSFTVLLSFSESTLPLTTSVTFKGIQVRIHSPDTCRLQGVLIDRHRPLDQTRTRLHTLIIWYDRKGKSRKIIILFQTSAPLAYRYLPFPCMKPSWNSPS